MSVRYASLFVRLVANSAKPDDQNEGGCWPWTAQLDRGYSRLTLRVNGRHVKRRGHRIMEQLLRDNARQFAADDALPGLLLAATVAPEPLPEAETLDHLCWRSECINPDHWEPVPNAENARRQQAQRPSGWWAARVAA